MRSRGRLARARSANSDKAAVSQLQQRSSQAAKMNAAVCTTQRCASAGSQGALPLPIACTADSKSSQPLPQPGAHPGARSPPRPSPPRAAGACVP